MSETLLPKIPVNSRKEVGGQSPHRAATLRQLFREPPIFQQDWPLLPSV